MLFDWSRIPKNVYQSWRFYNRYGVLSNNCQFVSVDGVPCRMRDTTSPPISLAEEIERIERALSVTEVARLLSLCRASVYRYIDAGIIPAIRIRNDSPD
jgi:excisionase family DNA binding protein